MHSISSVACLHPSWVPPVSVLSRCPTPSQRSPCVDAIRQEPMPWDVVEPQQQSTAWQQRQQQQQQQQQQQLNRQRRQRQKASRPGQPGQVRPQQQQQQAQQATTSSTHTFSGCHSFQALYTALQQRVLPQQSQDNPQSQQVDPQRTQQLDQQQPEPQQQGNIEQSPGEVPRSLDADDPQPAPQLQPHPLLLSAQDCVNLVDQLGAIARVQQATSSSGSSTGSPAGNSFVEDQALQHTLALVYAQLDHLSLLQQQQQTMQQSGSTAGPLSPQQLLRVVNILAGLKYSQPVQLALWLDTAAAAAAGVSNPAIPAAAGGAGAAAAAASAAGAAADSASYRQVLSGLKMRELSSLVCNLARSGVRPSKVWLLAFMQVAQQKLSQADVPQLAQLLSGLVKVGVKPTTAWLDSMEDRAVQCLLEQAVRQQVSTDQQQQQPGTSPTAIGSTGSTTSTGSTSKPLQAVQQQQQQQQQDRFRGQAGSLSRRTSSSSSHSCQCHNVAQLLTALAEARHPPKPQLAAVMWGATAGCLAASDSGALCELIIALGELQLVPPASWLQLYFAAASNAALQYRPWQLAGTAAAVGKLAVASRAGSRPKQQQQQQFADQTGCKVWVGATLSAVVQQLPAFAARDLSALLSGLAALQVQVGSAQLQALLAEMQAKLPRLNTAGLAAVTEAVVDLCQQQVDQQQQQVEGQQQQQQQVEGQQEDGIPTKFAQQQQQQQVTPPVLHVAGGFMDALLREVAVKLPVFPAEDLARMLLAVAAAGVQPSQLWCQAVAAQLGSKLTLLEPPTLVAVLSALVSCGSPPDKAWVLQAAAALNGRLMELPGRQLQQLLALLVAVGVAPAPAWLGAAQRAAQQQQQQQQQQQHQQHQHQQQQGVLEAKLVQWQQQPVFLQAEECEKLFLQLRQLQQQHDKEQEAAMQPGLSISNMP